MSLLWCEGFDSFGDAFNASPQPAGIMGSKYDSINDENRFRIDSGAPLSGRSLRIVSGAYSPRFVKTFDNPTTLIAGIRVYLWSMLYNGSLTTPLFEFRDGNTKSVSLILANGSLRVETGNNNNVVGMARIHLPTRQWHHIQMKAYCHTTNGTIEIRANGCPVIQLSSINTDVGGNGYFTSVRVLDTTPINYVWSFIDDFYVCDDDGSTNNDFLGPVTVDTIYPDGDDSVNFATTGNANYANHYQQVGVEDAMWTTDYIEDSNTGNRDIFTLENTSNFETIHGVMGCIVAEGVSSNQNYTQILSSNGTEIESSNFSANTSTNKTNTFVVESDPDTSSAWTPATVNALKFGIELK